MTNNKATIIHGVFRSPRKTVTRLRSVASALKWSEAQVVEEALILFPLQISGTSTCNAHAIKGLEPHAKGSL